MKPTLLVLAAGMGSRYGGLKQIDPVGLNDVSANTSLKLYPNPASDIVQLNYAFEGQQQLEIQILDAVGRVVKSEKATALNGYQKQLNFANQPKGYYIVSITSENGTVKKELLIQ